MWFFGKRRKKQAEAVQTEGKSEEPRKAEPQTEAAAETAQAGAVTKEQKETVQAGAVTEEQKETVQARDVTEDQKETAPAGAESLAEAVQEDAVNGKQPEALLAGAETENSEDVTPAGTETEKSEDVTQAGPGAEVQKETARAASGTAEPAETVPEEAGTEKLDEAVLEEKRTEEPEEEARAEEKTEEPRETVLEIPVQEEAGTKDFVEAPENAENQMPETEQEIEAEKFLRQEVRMASDSVQAEQETQEPGQKNASGSGQDRNISLYDWGQKKKKKKKKKSRNPAVKKVVRLGEGEKSVVLGEGMPKICVPVTGRTLEEIVDQAANAASAFPDLVEWRVDCFEEVMPLQASPEQGEMPVNTVSSVFPAVDRALKKISEALDGIPLLFTVRTEAEGGHITLFPEDYIGLLLHAAERPEVSAIDVEELRTDVDMEILTREIQEKQKPVIGSAHFFNRMPKKDEILDIMDRISRTGADVLKLAAMPSDDRDVCRLMAAAEEENRLTDRPIIAIAMGKKGMLSRVSGCVTGSCLTFGTVDAQSAPGQIPVQTLRIMLEALQSR